MDIPATSDNIPGTLVLRDNSGGFDLKPASIVDADVSATAAIADTKLATISTAGKVSNSATTATSANTVNSIVARDASGNFSAGTITANVTGNASTATTLATGRTIALTGDVTGTTGSFNGSANVSAATTIANNAVTTAKIADANVTTAKIADSNLTTAKIANDAVDNTKLRDSAALSVIGRSANSSGDPADIAAATDGHVLRRSGTTLGFGQVATGGITDAAVTTAKIADANVTTAKIADANVTTVKIADDSVTDAKLSLAANAGEIKKALNADNAPPIFACRAWVNFDGTAGVTVGGEFLCTIRGSGNVSKVVRETAGIYVISFTTAMPDANYTAVANSGNLDGGTPGEATNNSNRLVGSFKIYTFNSSSLALTNRSDVSACVFR